MRVLNPSNLPTIDYRSVQPLQGDLKDLTKVNYTKLKNILNKRGFYVPLFIWFDGDTPYLCDGHQRLRVMRGEDFQPYEVPYVEIQADTKAEAKAKLLEISSQYGHITQEGWDEFVVDLPEAEIIEAVNFDALPFLGALEGEEAEVHKSLAERFIVPPFSVLDARQGYWQERKKSWLELGIKSEEGRGDDLAYGAAKGRNDVVSLKIMDAGGGTSVFDPVLCEVMYHWFVPTGGSVLDPFAGGSVRGIVAHKGNHKYTGIELQDKQVKANYANALEVLGKDHGIDWLTGDSLKMDTLLSKDKLYDFVFSCPPYADLEVYSDDPADISNMEYPKFLEVYKSIITKAIAKLKPNRFAAFVVGDVRDGKGFYRNFVGDTVNAFQEAGATLYNEAILVTAIGSLPVRVGKAFSGGRKLGKCHQNVLVFYKGDPKAIKANYPALEEEVIEQKDWT